MRRLVFLESAIGDFTSILTYIANESGSAGIARGFTRRLQEQCGKLAGFPGVIGRSRPELGADLRSFAFKGCVIFFRYRDDMCEIVNVLEDHRDIVAYFTDDEDRATP